MRGSKFITTKNRGKYLETVIDASNRQYKQKGIAVINKIPTPTQVIRKGKKLTGAFYTEKSTVDFIGIYDGTFIAFDAKECSEPRFAFNRLEGHQLDYLISIKEQGGQGFIIVLFKQENEMYRLTIEEYIELKDTINRKSIPLKWFQENKRPIKRSNGIAFNYLEDN